MWVNEKKIVKFAKVILRGEKEIKSNLDPSQAEEANSFDLVHMCGKTQNKTDITDSDFEINVPNSYRLSRKVEVY